MKLSDVTLDDGHRIVRGTLAVRCLTVRGVTAVKIQRHRVGGPLLIKISSIERLACRSIKRCPIGMRYGGAALMASAPSRSIHISMWR